MRREAGLTLLELMVVVFILSALALSAVSLVDTTDHQLRREDTQGRLFQLRRAIVGEAGEPALSGYVADMGVLPTCVGDLVAAPSSAEAFGLKQAEFSSSITLPATHALPKGWRGPYVVRPPGTDPSAARFRDGWGNVSRDAGGDPDTATDASEHGWTFDVDAGALTITSRGADGTPGDSGETEYDADLSVEIASGEWRVDLSGWSVDLRNATGTTRSGLYVRLLVYGYEATSGHAWTAHDTGTVDLADAATGSVTFPEGTVVPIGRHLLVVVDSDDEPFGHPASYVTRQVAFAPRSLPQVTLVIP